MSVRGAGACVLEKQTLSHTEICITVQADICLKLRAAQDLRDDVSRESYQREPDYLRFIELLLPVIINQLSTATQPVLWSCASAEVRQRLVQEGTAQASKHPHGVEALQNGLRYLLLETLHRFGHQEPLRAHAANLMQLLLKLMETENEDNAILALKIVIDLHRSYKDTIGNTAAGFLDLVKQVYANMPEVIRKTFGDENGKGTATDEDDDAVAATPAAGHESGTPGSTSAPTPGSAPLSARSATLTGTAISSSADSQPIQKLPAGMKSLKLLAECPIAVVFLFQTYRDIVPTELKIFVPLVFSVSNAPSLSPLTNH